MERDPFVTEVTRIIKRARPSKYGQNTIVLVSQRFYDAAIKQATEINRDVFDLEFNSKLRYLYFRGILIHSAPWLSDYEFEIRPPMLFAGTDE